MATGLTQLQGTQVAQAPPSSGLQPKGGAAGTLRGKSFGEGQHALSPKTEGAAKAAVVTLTDKQVSAAQTYNLESHSLSMLGNIRDFLIRNGTLAKGGVDDKPRVNIGPKDVVDAAFVRAVAKYQQAKGLAGPDGKIGPVTFDLFEANGLVYTKSGGTQPAEVASADGKKKVARTVLPKNAPADRVFEYFKAVVLEQGGIFLDKPGYVNIIGIRCGKLAADGAVQQTTNAFNKWNDTLVVLRTSTDGKKKHVSMYEGTTDPGVAIDDVATLPEGTHAMAMGTHKGYTALTPAFSQKTPVLRGKVTRLGNEGASGGVRGGGLALNIHTTHNYEKGLPDGPGAYSEGCAVINGEDSYKGFIDQMTGATKPASKGGPGQTYIYYTVISAARLDTLVVEQQRQVGMS